jgi:hypothetical protein
MTKRREHAGFPEDTEKSFTAKDAKDFAKSAKKTVDLNIKNENPKTQRTQRIAQRTLRKSSHRCGLPAQRH